MKNKIVTLTIIHLFVVSDVFADSTLFVYSNPASARCTTEAVVPDFESQHECLLAGAAFMAQSGKLSSELGFACGISCKYEKSLLNSTRIHYGNCEQVCTNKGDCFEANVFAGIIQGNPNMAVTK